MEHDFIQVGAGGIGRYSWSHQKCTICGQKYIHYYNKQKFQDAIKDIKKCKGWESINEEK